MSDTKPKTNKNDVSAPSVIYERMRHRGKWDLLEDLLGGTFVMQDRAQKWLPMEKGEDPEVYAQRLSRSYLFPGYSEALDKIVSRPFSRPLSAKKDLPKEIAFLWKDVDGVGTSMAEFGRQVLYWAVDHGVVHVFVDFSDVPEGLSRAEEAQAGARATFMLVPAPALFFWRTDPDTGHLTEIRIKEVRVEPDGQFGDKEVPYIRRITLEGFELYRKSEQEDDKSPWKLVRQGEHNALQKIGGIPLFSLFTHRKPGSRMEARPPLLRLAEKNLEHWTNASDQSNILHYARVPIMLATGFEDEVVEKGITIAPNAMVKSRKADASLTWVEHSGGAVDSGEKHNAELREDMRALGLAPFLPKAGMGDVKATGQAIDEARNQSEVQMWVRAEEMLFRQIFEAAAKWHGVKLPEDWKVDIYQEFTISIQSERDLEALLRLREAGDIDQRTILVESKRRGTIAESADVDEIIAETKKEQEAEANKKPDTGFKPADNEEENEDDNEDDAE